MVEPQKFIKAFEKQFNYLKEQNVYLKREFVSKDDKIKDLRLTGESTNDNLEHKLG